MKQFLLTIILIFLLGNNPLWFIFWFSGKISPTSVFCAYLAVLHLSQECQLSVYTYEVLKFQATSSLTSQAQLSSVMFCVWTCILYSFQTPSWTHLLNTSTLFAGWASVAGVVRKLEYLLFKGPCSLCCVSKKEKGMQRWHTVSLTGESFKIPQSTSPPLFVPVQEGWGEITREQSSVCECVYALDVCAIVPVRGFVMLTYVYLCHQTFQKLACSHFILKSTACMFIAV